MAGTTSRKRNHQDYGAKSSNSQKQNKRQKQRQFEYHSDSDEEQNSNPDFKPVNLLDSDNEDLENIAVDDVASASSGSDSDSAASSSGSETTTRQKKPSKSSAAAAEGAATRGKKRKAVPDTQLEAGDDNEEDDDDHKNQGASDEEGDENEEDDDNEDSDSDASDEDEDGDGALTATTGAVRRTGANKSKRNDPTAFATSLSKILSTKLSTGRRADPVLARSADAQQAAREVLDSALEAKARKQMREQRRLALEKGRVRDVLGGGVVASGADHPTADPEAAQREKSSGSTGTGEGVAYTQQSERRLRKVAHRGVVVLFRAVREAQERAAQAERDARRDGIYGVKTREEKVSEMSRQGFLDLIANGGGKLKQGALEEA